VTTEPRGRSSAGAPVVGRVGRRPGRWLAGPGTWVAYCEGGCASLETLMGDMANNSAGASDASPA